MYSYIKSNEITDYKCFCIYLVGKIKYLILVGGFIMLDLIFTNNSN